MVVLRAVFSLALIVVLAMTGCRSGFSTSKSGDEIVFTVNKGIASFSFAASSEYVVDVLRTYRTATWLFVDDRLQPGESVRAFVDVFLEIPISENDTAANRLDKELERLGRYEGFILLEQREATIDGSPAREIRYTFLQPIPDFQLRQGLEPYPAAGRALFFSQRGIIWDMSIFYQRTTDPLANKHEADFDRILETFKILEVRERES